MAYRGRLELDISSVSANAIVTGLISDPFNKGLFSQTGKLLTIQQNPGWYVPDPLIPETRINYYANGTNEVFYGKIKYRFTAQTEGARASTIWKILDILCAANNHVVTLRDYCSLYGEQPSNRGTAGIFYKERTGRLTYSPPQVPMVNSAGKILYETGLELRFEEF